MHKKDNRRVSDIHGTKVEYGEIAQGGYYVAWGDYAGMYVPIPKKEVNIIRDNIIRDNKLHGIKTFPVNRDDLKKKPDSIFVEEAETAMDAKIRDIKEHHKEGFRVDKIIKEHKPLELRIGKLENGLYFFAFGGPAFDEKLIPEEVGVKMYTPEGGIEYFEREWQAAEAYAAKMFTLETRLQEKKEKLWT